MLIKKEREKPQLKRPPLLDESHVSFKYPNILSFYLFLIPQVPNFRILSILVPSNFFAVLKRAYQDLGLSNYCPGRRSSLSDFPERGAGSRILVCSVSGQWIVFDLQNFGCEAPEIEAKGAVLHYLYFFRKLMCPEKIC